MPLCHWVCSPILSYFMFFSCVCARICAGMRAWGVHACIWSPQVDIENLPPLLSILLIDKGFLSWAQRLIIWLVWQCHFLWGSPISAFQTGILGGSPQWSTFFVGSSDLNSSPHTCQVNTLVIEPSPQPSSDFSDKLSLLLLAPCDQQFSMTKIPFRGTKQPVSAQKLTSNLFCCHTTQCA